MFGFHRNPEVLLAICCVLILPHPCLKDLIKSIVKKFKNNRPEQSLEMLKVILSLLMQIKQMLSWVFLHIGFLKAVTNMSRSPSWDLRSLFPPYDRDFV